MFYTSAICSGAESNAALPDGAIFPNTGAESV
jgi:hypothetical protein